MVFGVGAVFHCVGIEVEFYDTTECDLSYDIRFLSWSWALKSPLSPLPIFTRPWLRCPSVYLGAVLAPLAPRASVPAAPTPSRGSRSYDVAPVAPGVLMLVRLALVVVTSPPDSSDGGDVSPLALVFVMSAPVSPCCPRAFCLEVV